MHSVNSIVSGLPDGSAGQESACNTGVAGPTPGLERSTGRGHGNHSSILAWKVSWTEEPGGPTAAQRAGHHCLRGTGCIEVHFLTLTDTLRCDQRMSLLETHTQVLQGQMGICLQHTVEGLQKSPASGLQNMHRMRKQTQRYVTMKGLSMEYVEISLSSVNTRSATRGSKTGQGRPSGTPRGEGAKGTGDRRTAPAGRKGARFPLRSPPGRLGPAS